MSAHDKSLDRTAGKIDNTALFYKSADKKSAPQRCGPVKILEIDETGETAKFQSRTFKVARFRAREKAEEKDAEAAKLDPLGVRLRTVGPDLGKKPGQLNAETGMDVAGETRDGTLGTGIPDCDSGPYSATIPLPSSPFLSV